MLFQPPYLGTIGEGGYQWVNAADMTNNGIELEIGYRSNPAKSFTYSIRGNISHNKNTIATPSPVCTIFIRRKRIER